MRNTLMQPLHIVFCQIMRQRTAQNNIAVHYHVKIVDRGSKII